MGLQLVEAAPELGPALYERAVGLCVAFFRRSQVNQGAWPQSPVGREFSHQQGWQREGPACCMTRTIAHGILTQV